MAELGHSEPRGCPPGHRIMCHYGKVPQTPEATVLTKVTFASPGKEPLDSRVRTPALQYSLSPKDPTNLGSFMAQRDLKDNRVPFPTPFYHEVTEVQEVKNSLSNVKSKNSASRTILSSLPHLYCHPHHPLPPGTANHSPSSLNGTSPTPTSVIKSSIQHPNTTGFC